MPLNEEYESYRSTRDKGLPTAECVERLYPFVKQRAAQAVVSVLHRAAPEELVITLTTNVLMDIEKFKPGKSAFASWVFLKAKHDCINELRRGEPPYIDPIVGEDGLPHFQNWAFDHDLRPSPDPSDADKWSGRLDQRRSRNVLEQAGVGFEDDALLDLYTRIETVLSDEEQELVRLKFDGLQGEEIAEVLDISHQNVRQRFAAIKKKLQKAA